jgi:deoxyxylulose-5-phosphate synthase
VPVDPALTRAAANYRLVVTVEDNAASGGFGDAFARSLRASRCPTTLLTLALRDGFATARERADLHRRHGLDAEGVTKQVLVEFARTKRTPQSRGSDTDCTQPDIRRAEEADMSLLVRRR